MTAAAGQAVSEPTAAAAVDAAVEGTTASSATGAQDEAVLTDAQQPQNPPYAHSPQSVAQAPIFSGSCRLCRNGARERGG